MIKKITFILLSLITAFAFCGCQLAVEEKGTAAAEPNTDVLCGMFITFEYLNTQEDYLDDAALNAVMNGDQAQLYNQEAAKIYAAIEDNGLTKDFVFKGIEGLRLFGVFVPGDGDRGSYNMTCKDEPLLDCKTAYNKTDEGMELTLEATLYVCPKEIGEDDILNCYCNPVYQTPDGQVYMTAGEGLSTDMQTGISMTSTLSGTMENTVNGEKESRKATVKLTVVAIDYIEKYVLKEYDSEDRVVSTLEITKGSVPTEITLNKDTDYAILEKHCIDEDGKPYTERSIVDMNSEYLDARFINERGLAQGYGITLKNIPA